MEGWWRGKEVSYVGIRGIWWNRDLGDEERLSEVCGGGVCWGHWAVWVWKRVCWRVLLGFDGGRGLLRA